MRAASEPARQGAAPFGAVGLRMALKPLARLLAPVLAGMLACAPAWAGCQRPVYLTLDTGHMAVAPLIAQVLARQQVRVTFFAAHEKTQTGDGSLGADWAAWWQARGREGHAFASHTWEHAYWVADDAAGGFHIRPSSGPQAGQRLHWSAPRYCTSLHRASARLQQLTGRTPLPLFRAPGGRHSPALLQAAQACGYRHVGWSPAGFLGDELPSDRFSNAHLLRQALARIRSGDVLMAHLGIWSRQQAWAPAVLEPLIEGLKARGHCFETLDAHPDWADWVRQHPLAPQPLQAAHPTQFGDTDVAH